MNNMVFISGATGGFGRSMAVECASRGWNLFLTDLDGEKLENLAAAIASAWHVDIQMAACNLADKSERTTLINQMREKGVILHMAINVAGLDYEGLFLHRSREQIMDILNVNVMSTVDMMYSLTAFRNPTRTFRIINVCSLAGMFPMPVKATYAASKRLLIDLSLALREEFKSINGTVTALCPAGMVTNEVLLKSLEAQGIGGKVTTLEVATIARKTIDASCRGKAVYIPGFVNRVLFSLGRIFPSTFVARLIGKRWKRTNRALEAKCMQSKAHTQ